MPRPQRIQLSRKKGFRLQEYSRALNGLECVVVRRPTKWGNPFPITPECSRAEAVKRFRTLITSFDEPTWQQHIHELRGKNLACTCPLDQPCHADTLLELANTPKAPE